MAKVTSAEIVAMGFKKEFFHYDSEAAFLLLIDGLIPEQAAVLEYRIGATLYNTVTSPTAERVKRAEKCLCAAEVIQRRINIILANAIGAGAEIDVSQEMEARKAYLDEAEVLITDMAVYDSSTTGGDANMGVSVSGHFGDT